MGKTMLIAARMPWQPLLGGATALSASHYSGSLDQALGNQPANSTVQARIRPTAVPFGALRKQTNKHSPSPTSMAISIWRLAIRGRAMEVPSRYTPS